MIGYNTCDIKSLFFMSTWNNKTR